MYIVLHTHSIEMCSKAAAAECARALLSARATVDCCILYVIITTKPSERVYYTTVNKDLYADYFHDGISSVS